MFSNLMVMFSWISGMSWRSSSCEGIYKLIKRQDCNDWFKMRMIWKYGKIGTGVGILTPKVL
jgi:hypothetical protein